MMQSADLWESDNGTCRGWLYRSTLRTILGQGEMRSRLVVVLKVRRQHSAQVTLIEDDDVVETFAADRADDALDIGVLPRRSRRGDDLLDSHRFEAIAENLTVRCVAVSQQISR